MSSQNQVITKQKVDLKFCMSGKLKYERAKFTSDTVAFLGLWLGFVLVEFDLFLIFIIYLFLMCYQLSNMDDS